MAFFYLKNKDIKTDYIRTKVKFKNNQISLFSNVLNFNDNFNFDVLINFFLIKKSARATFSMIFIFFPVFSRFLNCLLFSLKECWNQATYLAKVDRSTQNFRGRTLTRPRRPFCDPGGHLDFAGGAALQAVSERPWYC